MTCDNNLSQGSAVTLLYAPLKCKTGIVKLRFSIIYFISIHFHFKVVVEVSDECGLGLDTIVFPLIPLSQWQNSIDALAYRGIAVLKSSKYGFVYNIAPGE